MRSEGELSIPGDSKDFRGAIQRNYVVTYFDLRVQVRLVGVRGEQSSPMTYYGGRAMGSSFLPVHSTSVVINRLAFTTASSTLDEEAMMVKSSA